MGNMQEERKKKKEKQSYVNICNFAKFVMAPPKYSCNQAIIFSNRMWSNFGKKEINIRELITRKSKFPYDKFVRGGLLCMMLLHSPTKKIDMIP